MHTPRLTSMAVLIFLNLQTENASGNVPRPTTASAATKNASNIFGGGAFADDAARSRSAASSRAPTANVARAAAGGGGPMPSARAMAQAQQRGSGSLW